MKLTKHKFSILALALILVLALAAFFGVNSIQADAAGTITVSGTNVFTATGNAGVAGSAVGEGENTKYYTTFTFTGDDDEVSYRRNLAYYWFQAVETQTGEDDNESETGAAEPVKGEAGLFNMTVGFKSLSFKKFVIAFESQQFNKTKENKTVNYIMFFPAGEGKVNALITDDKDAELDANETYAELDAAEIVIEFTGKTDVGYAVSVGNAGGGYVAGSFENVGGNYSRSSTSSASPVYPLIFSSEFADDASENQAQMVLFSLNGQEFEQTSSTSNTVTDNAPPVLCLTKEIRYFKQGGAIDANYVAIDVLRTSPTTPKLNYYILSVDDYKKNGEQAINFTDKEIYKEVESDFVLESDRDKYLPVNPDLFEGTEFKSVRNTADKEKLTTDMLVKVYVHLADTSSTSNAEETDVFLDWYVPDNYLIKLNKGGENESAFMAVAKDELGATYNYNGKGNQSWEEIKEEYQQQVNELARNLSAGSSNYLYLPSAEKLFTDNATAYTDLRLSIYYYHSSQSSNTGLATNNLSINVTAEDKYVFTIFAADAAGNDMYYIDADGEVQTFGANKIWDMYNDNETEDGLYNKLPWFTFSVGYKGVEFEETPGMQPTAYVGTAYSSATFKINGVSGSYTTEYELYLFDRARYYNATGTTFSYEDFIAVMDELFEAPATRIYFENIPAVTENDENYETYKDYGWSNSSTTFTPQVANAFYYIRAELRDGGLVSSPVTSSLAVVSSESARAIPGENDWLAENVASVVLLSIAGVALIGIILLLVIKPKNKDDIDVEFEKKTKKKK